jgi:hypothetical protein
MRPKIPHETTNQHHAGTTFAEGLVFLKKKRFFDLRNRRFVCGIGG